MVLLDVRSRLLSEGLVLRATTILIEDTVGNIISLHYVYIRYLVRSWLHCLLQAAPSWFQISPCPLEYQLRLLVQDSAAALSESGTSQV